MNNPTIEQKQVEEYWYRKLSRVSFPGLFYKVQDDVEQQRSITITIPDAVTGVVSRLAQGSQLGEYVIYLSLFGFLTGKYYRERKLLIYSPAISVPNAAVNDGMRLFHELNIAADVDLKRYIHDVSAEVSRNIGYAYADYASLSNRFADRKVDEELIHSMGFCYIPLQATCMAEIPVKWLLIMEVSGGGQLAATLKYNRYLMEDGVAADFLDRYNALLGQLDAHLNIHIPLNKIEILNTAERDRIFFSFNDKTTNFSRKTLVQLFEEQVKKEPTRAALQCYEEQLTYQELKISADRLSRHLWKQKGNTAGRIVGLLLDRSFDIGIAAMAVLKAGDAFVPIDPRLPEDRILSILKDARPDLVITQSAHLHQLSDYEGGLFIMDVQLQGLGSLEEDLPAEVSFDSLLYVLYTSGTTGMPKGAMVHQEAMVNLIAGLNENFLSSGMYMQMTVVAAYIFDPFWKQFFLAILGGHTLHIIPEDIKLEARLMWDYYSRYAIALTDGTPSLLNVLLTGLPGAIVPLQLRYFMIGGESLGARPLIRLYDYFSGRGVNITVINEYGLTECCVDNICYLIDRHNLNEDLPVPVGKPLPNNQVLILDADNRLVPVGCYGQIAILGKGVGWGYLNNPELTAEKFIDSPFIAFTGKLYLTGDVGKWLPDGNIVCAGRLDSQVKVNGYRIELGDLESAMYKMPGVREAVAQVREYKEKKEIVVYWVGSHSLDAPAVQEGLAKYLPGYMLPSYYCRLEQMPLTINGKIDKQALPDPRLPGSSGEAYVAPVTPMEHLLADIWQQVIGMSSVGIRNDFFLNGGDSIKAIQIASQLHSMGYKMEVGSIFLNPTIEQLATVIRKLERMPDQGIVTGEIPLTPVQREFFVIHPSGLHHYNQSVLLKYTGKIAPDKIKAMFAVLLEHHDALRIIFKSKGNGDWVQINKEAETSFYLHVFNWEQVERTEEIFRVTAEKLQRSIDLENGPLIKVGLFQMKDCSRLLIVVHHLVMDAVSFRIILEDLATLDELYDAGKPLQLPVKTDAYKVWADNLIAYAAAPEFLRERRYWMQQLIAICKSTGAGKKLITAASAYDRYSFELSPALTALLTGKANKAFNTEVQDLLITAVLMAISSTWNESNIAMMLEGHGREPIVPDIDVSRTVGWFTTIYPVLFDLTSDEELADRVITVKEAIRSVPKKGIGYGIFKYLASEEVRADIPIDVHVPVIFNYLGYFNADAQNGSFKLADEDHGMEREPAAASPYNMEITAVIVEGRLHMGLFCRYPGRDPVYVRRFWDAVQSHLHEIIRYASSREQAQLTPADLSYKQLDKEELDMISRMYNVQDIYPLSPMQEGILFSCLYNDRSPSYLEQLSYRVRSSDLDPVLIKSSMERLIRRHDVLRTVFLFEGVSRPLQVVLKEQKAAFLFEDLREQKDRLAYVRHFKERDRQQTFELQSDMLLRVAIFRLEEGEYEFVWTHHHLLMDAWCEGLLIGEYYSIYNSLQKAVSINLPPVKSYSTYIRWIEEQDVEKANDYWKRYLSSFEKCSRLPIQVRNNSSASTADRKTGQQISLDAGVTTALYSLAAKYSVTVNTILEVVWGVLLSRYNNTNDVVFGSVVSGRPAEIAGVDSIIGLFINTIPVRIRYNSETRFSQLLKEIQFNALQSESYHYTSLSEIQLLSGHQPLLDHIILFDNYPSAEYQLSQSGRNMKTSIPDIYNAEVFEIPHYDLNIRIIPGSNLVIRFDYNGALYSSSGIARVLAQFEHLLMEALADPERPIPMLDILPPEERMYLKLLSQGQSVDRPFLAITEHFGKWVADDPDKIALIYRGRAFTYEDLHQRASSLAVYLAREHEAAKGLVIGIMLDRTDLMMVAILGVLATGAGFLPVDIALPLERKEFMLKDAGIRLLITTADCMFAVQDYYQHDLVVLDLLNLDNEMLPAKPDIRYEPNSLAYLLYTSGSTGEPKGVKVTMSSLVNYLEWANEYYFNNSIGHCFALFTSLSFDLTVTSLFSGILRGDKVVIFDSEMKTAELLINLFESEGEVDTLKMTPSHVDLLPGMLRGQCAIKTVILGGEPVRDSHISVLRRLNPSIRIFNEYGPTEATVGCTVKEIGQLSEVWSIGRPVYNTQIHILDTSLNLQPLQAVGEVFISGSGVAQGYHGQEALTKEKFLMIPGMGDKVMYRTGDLARWAEDGEIEYLGRIDEQLKVQGYRIEPAEVEKAMLSVPGITAAVVTAVANRENDKELVCYYTAIAPVQLQNIKEYLNSKLPAFMMPAHFTRLETLPLNINGKVDKRELPLPDYSARLAGMEYIAPVNPTEEQLLAIWEDVLEKHSIGVLDNFFSLGGNSLKIVRLYDMIRRSFQYQVKISELFDNPTIKQQAAILEEGSGNLRGSVSAVTVIDF